ncbi:MAG: glycosidase, partial [Lachnospiraceae bacterium]|nr:glycosidase [Lachnospiraceae bacterium]
MTEEGYIEPDQKWIRDMFFRKPGLPLLMVRMPDGSEVPYWNTFYQEVRYERPDAQDLMKITGNQYGIAAKIADIIDAGLEEGKKPVELDFGILEAYKEAAVGLLEKRRRYLGQMDLNIKSPLVWDYYADTLRRLAEYGAKIVRLDAF